MRSHIFQYVGMSSVIDGIFDLINRLSLRNEMHSINEAYRDPPLQRAKDVPLETICRYSRIARLSAKGA